MLQALPHMSCLPHYVTAEALPYIFQVTYSIRTTSYVSRIIRLFSRPYKWLGMVRLAEFKGLNLITLKLSYSSTAIELSSEPVLSKLCQMSLRMVILSFPTKSRCP